MHHDEMEFGLERRLKELDPELHRRFADTVFAMQHALTRYQMLFPGYTDHTMLHSLSVIDFCNQLIGPARLLQLNADEIYVLLVSCYLHDIGMGISQRDYDEFSKTIDFGTYFENHSKTNTVAIIRDFHHEYSGAYIHKYAAFLELPSPEHTFAVAQVSRGHRRTDLFDEKEYPNDWAVPNGNTICLPYLAALIRLADEIDVAASRNMKMLYDIESIADLSERFYHILCEACQRLDITENAFIMVIRKDKQEMLGALQILQEKIEATLDLCRSAVQDRTPYTITQRRVDIQWLETGEFI